MPWPIAELGKVCAVTMGQAPAGASYNDRLDGVPLIAGAGDFGNGVPIAKKHTTEPSKVCRVGDIVISIRASIGDRVLADGEYCLGRGVAGLRPRSALSDRYLWHWLGWSSPRLAEKGRGATFLQVNRSDIAEMPIPLPPIGEQRRIAEILDRADALRAKRREALTLTDNLTHSIFLDMFGRAEPGWPTVSVVDLTDSTRGGMRTGPFGSQLLHSEFVDSGIAVLGIDNAVHNEFRWGAQRYITETKYRELRRYTVQAGDVLITIMGTCGRAAIVPDDIPTAINTKHLCCISLDRARCLPEYLHAYFLGHPDALRYLQRTAKGAIMSGLNMGIIKAMPIAVPPMSMQTRFLAVLTQISSRARSAKQSFAAIEALFGALQQRAFAGEL